MALLRVVMTHRNTKHGAKCASDVPIHGIVTGAIMAVAELKSALAGNGRFLHSFWIWDLDRLNIHLIESITMETTRLATVVGQHIFSNAIIAVA